MGTTVPLELKSEIAEISSTPNDAENLSLTGHIENKWGKEKH